MNPKRKRLFFNLLGLFLSGLFLYLCFRSLDKESLKSVFLLPKPWVLAAVIVCNFILMGFRTEMWRLLLKPLGKTPFFFLFDVLHVGTMANTLLPLKAGEFFRATFVSKKYNYRYTQVLTTVGLERYFSGFSLLLVFLLVTSYLNVPLWLKTSAYVLGAILIGVQLSLMVLWKKKPNLEKWEKRHPAIYRTIEFLFHVGEGSHSLRSLPSFLTLVLLGLVTWAIQGAMLKTVEYAFNVTLPWIPTLFVLVAINLAIALPSAPGNIGTFEFAAVLAYKWLQIDKPTALGVAFYFHFLQAIPMTLVGLFYYFRWGLRLKDLEEAEVKKVEAMP